MIGRIVSNFEILARLGAGGMGVVYKARDLKLGRFVALKFLPPESCADEHSKARFMQEARAPSLLDHQNICTVYQVGESDEGQLFIAMAYYEGDTIKEKLAKGPIPVDQAIRIANQVAHGLEHAHMAGIVHRDIKPANVLVTREGVAKILDFGLAKLASGGHLTRGGMALGTLPYMSPEQAEGLATDHRTDLWSLAVLIYEMVTGRLPFRGDSPGAVIHAILYTDPALMSELRSAVPPDLERIVKKGLTKDPRFRVQSAREFAAALQYCAGGSEPGATMSWETATVAPVTSRTWAPEQSIAVLPFINIGGDQEQEYFSDGITEEIISQLSRVPGFRVIARTSVMRLKNTTKDIEEIARELRVSHVLEGSVRRAGNRIRITSGLVDAGSRQQLWTEIYDRDLTDIFTIQTDVSRRIADALSANMSPSQRARLRTQHRDINAYQLFLKARYFLNKVTPESVQKAIRLFQESLDIDPADSGSYAGLSTCFATAGHFDFMPPLEAFPRAKAAAEKALQLNRSLAEAQTSMGLVSMFYDWDWQAADRHFRGAIDSNPNWAEAHAYWSWYLCCVRDFDRAVREAMRATDLDPLSLFMNTNLGWVLLMAGRLKEAVEQLQRSIDIEPGYLPAHAVLGDALIANGKPDEGLPLVLKGAWRSGFVCLGYVWSGRLQEARQLLAEMLAPGSPHRYRPSEIGLAHLLLGEREQASEWLDKAIQQRDYMLALHMCPDWAPGRDDPLVVEHLQKMGLNP